ncbi:flagellar assembly peptidoglycan hydrolase FlgJ [Chromobacterium violaceum]|uniref:Peptidoglycan hydrolase FlgJ n=1 Tax=Chromobacterium violaceum TaxID=536 RepID=A0AAX2M6V7_CHRVL|nr:flagellar assembly peptidoglycan hydrolase FlgJ [Chromobacterium violaceum]OLZ75248.1 flagellar rod assembly protein/muramidase FlgJ [Chromobacterium violaceum]STB64220.1 Peptidoglycan hydrolase flgJ [Chromobacterium violaceum]SUX32005.1 Peptidoglycan hydrolase flgJ [Chromobacterium violaceum]
MTAKFQGLLPNDMLSRQLAADPTGLQKLKAKAGGDPKAAAKEAASQFEALLMNTMLKTMRATKFDESEASNSMDTFQGLSDQQMVQALCSRGGIGLGDMIYRQIAKQSGFEPDAGKDGAALLSHGPALAARPIGERAAQAYRNASGVSEAGGSSSSQTVGGGNKSFVGGMLSHARDAAQQLGVAPECVVAHAALESGWGKRTIRNADGTDSHNLFGIKAGGDWQGKTTTIMTTEYVGGVAQKRQETFRSYGSYAEAFTDYAKVLKSSSRYKNVLNQGQNVYGFAQGLQSGGYATDPRYARKLVDVAASLAQQVART